MKTINKMRFKSLLLTPLLLVMMSVPTTTMAAQPTVNLGTTSGFAILAGSTITNTGSTTISGSVGGDVGLFPGTVFTGQASVTMSGAVHLADDVAIKAKDDLVTAYDDAAGRTPVTRISSELGGTTLNPGTYDSADGTFQITGKLTLDAQGDADGVFIFKTASTLITASDSSITLINSARFCRTFWKVGSSATLGTNSHFVGHIFALESITANTGATVQGQLLARNGAVTLDANTITNGICDTIPPLAPAILHVIKHIINDNDGTAVAANFNLHVKTLGIDVATSPAPGVESPGNTYTLDAGPYVVSEDSFDGYTSTYSGDSDSSGNITLAPGDDKTVTITNNDISSSGGGGSTPAILHVIKHVINDNGRTAVAANFNIHVKTSGIEVQASPAPGIESPGNSYTLNAGSYVISEDSNDGYTATYSGDSDSSGNITLAPGDNKTVTITNDDLPLPSPAPAILHVIKHVINDNGGTAVASNFNLHVKIFGIEVPGSPSPGVESPGNTYTLAAGNYVLNEDIFQGYTPTYSGDSDSSGNITLAPGDDKTVTITNNDIRSSGGSGGNGGGGASTPAILHVIKHVINDNGRTAVAGNFNIHVKTSSIDVITSPAPGFESPGNSYTLKAGNYVISEDSHDGYTATYSGDSDSSGNISLAPGDNKTVIITNNDIPLPTLAPAILHVIKHVINDNGRTAVASNFNLHVKIFGIEVPGSPGPGVESPGNTYTLATGNYIVSEDAFDGYTATYSGDSDSSGNITLAPGDNKTVMITNDDTPLVVVIPPVTPPIVVSPTIPGVVTTPVTHTVTGGQLPDTSTNLYNILLIGAVLTLLGSLGWIHKKHHE